jgi:hypothetical protein
LSNLSRASLRVVRAGMTSSMKQVIPLIRHSISKTGRLKCHAPDENTIHIQDIDVMTI